MGYGSGHSYDMYVKMQAWLVVNGVLLRCNNLNVHHTCNFDENEAAFTTDTQSTELRGR